MTYYFVVYKQYFSSGYVTGVLQKVIDEHPLDYAAKHKNSHIVILFWSKITKELYDRYKGICAF